MAFTLGTSASGVGTTNTVDTTGMNVVVLYECYDGAGTVSDNKSNVWTSIGEKSSGGQNGQLYYSLNPIVGTGHNFITSVSYGGIVMAGFNSSNPSFDTSNGSSAGSATSIQAGNVTPSQDNTLVVAGLGLGGAAPNASNISINLGFGTRAVLPPVSGASYGAAIANLIEGVGSAVNPTWSWTNNAVSVAGIAVFKEIISSGINTKRLLMGVGI